MSKRAGKVPLDPSLLWTVTVWSTATELWVSEGPDTGTVSSLRQSISWTLDYMVHTLINLTLILGLHFKCAHNIPVHIKLCVYTICIFLFYYLCFCSVTVILLHCGRFCHEHKFLVCVNIPAIKLILILIFPEMSWSRMQDKKKTKSAKHCSVEG